MGRIGNDPELKTSAQGKPYVKLSLATHAYRKGKEGGKPEEITHWHRVMVFGTQASTCATWLRKGSQVLVEGSIEVRTWNDDKGEKQTANSILAHRVTFMGGYKSVEGETGGEIAMAAAG